MKLVDDARQFWRWWSVRAAALAGLVTGWIMSAPGQLYGLISYVPEYWRPAVGAGLGFMVFALPTLLRLIKQGGKSDG